MKDRPKIANSATSYYSVLVLSYRDLYFIPFMVRHPLFAPLFISFLKDKIGIVHPRSQGILPLSINSDGRSRRPWERGWVLVLYSVNIYGVLYFTGDFSKFCNFLFFSNHFSLFTFSHFKIQLFNPSLPRVASCFVVNAYTRRPVFKMVAEGLSSKNTVIIKQSQFRFCLSFLN